MNGSQQLQIDFRTGCLTAIHGDGVSDLLRSTCSAINSRRTRGILEAAKHTPSSQSVQAHVWATSFAQRALQWEVPLIDLNRLGIHHDEDGFISTSELKALTPGAEAHPYLDEQLKVVYKLFDLKPNGALGKKLMVSRDPEKTGLRPQNDIFDNVDDASL